MFSKLTRTLLVGAAVFVATTSQADVLVTANHIGVADNPKNRAIAQCLRAIYEYWPEDAGLMLPNQGRMQTQDGQRLISISGTIWRQGRRQSVSHECRSATRGKQTAMTVDPESASIALHQVSKLQ